MYVDEVVITCCNKDCGISFAVPSWWDRGKRETHTTFYCPNGHGQNYLAASETETLRRERDRLKQNAARLEDEKREAEERAAKAEAATKRLKKRVAAGVCPCCNRTVSQMQKHMAAKHPDYVKSNVVELKRA